jgi:hypothetical protein
MLVALAALALTAGVALAARPASVEAPAAPATDGLTQAAERAGKTVPDRAEEPALPDVDKGGDSDEDEDAPEVDEDATAAEAAKVTGERAQNHGWFVSQAAKGPTPATFDSHGRYVSEIAHSDQGKPAAAAAREAQAAKALKVAKTPKTSQ